LFDFHARKERRTGTCVLPLEAFVDHILRWATASNANSEAELVRRGPLGAGVEHSFMGKIVYPPCRTAVCAPTGWTGEQAEVRLFLVVV
jgi:hypothetical protein